MVDRPILFSPPMVRALLEGRKTQTRRALKPLLDDDGQPCSRLMCRGCGVSEREFKDGKCNCAEPALEWTPVGPMRFRVGDRLWGREAWRTFVSLDDVPPSQLLNGKRGAGVRFEADGRTLGVSKDGRPHYQHAVPPADLAAYGRQRAGMHMPRWASRLTLDVTGVRVQRLQEITEEDALAEGAGKPYTGDGDPPFTERATLVSSRRQYRNIWEKINGPGSWDENPWVVALTFSVKTADTT